jgi:His/Glu/Gln/Arg/opine family amino acid ABC transporter permease subunit
MIRTFSLGDFVYLLEAARWTLGLTVIAALGGGLIGLGVAFMRIARWRALRLMASLYIQVIQGTPLLILLFLFYFGLDIMACACQRSLRRRWDWSSTRAASWLRLARLPRSDPTSTVGGR